MREEEGDEAICHLQVMRGHSNNRTGAGTGVQPASLCDSSSRRYVTLILTQTDRLEWWWYSEEEQIQ